ncbi:MAG: Ig-like domain-containing protein [Spirochaetota bacterium]
MNKLLKIHRYVCNSAFIVIISILTIFISCSKEAPTVQPNPETKTSIVGTIGIDVPQIYAVFPGTLTSHTGTPGPMTGVQPGDYNPDITIVFTRQMDAASVQTAIQIKEGGTLLSPTITTTDNQIFNINLPSGRAASTTYTIRIYNSAHLNGDSTKTLNFDNLEDLYSGYLTTSGYVEFQFITTNGITPADTTPPTVMLTTPANGANNVDIDLLPLGYILIQFSEPVNPTTVTASSITLRDSALNPVLGSIGLLDGSNTRFFFMPSISLQYNETYTVTISPSGNEIKDYAGNNSSLTSVTFTTVNYASLPAASLVHYYIVYDYNSTPNQITVYWSTDRKSIKHIEIDDAESFGSADTTVHDTLTYATYHSHTFTGLARNQVYSLRICTDSNTGTPSGGPFDNTYIYNAIIRTIPDENEGTTGNYKLSVSSGTKTDIHVLQINTNTSFIIWNDNGTDIKAQFIDSSVGTPETWDTWAPNGVNVFSNLNIGTLSTLLHNSNCIVSRTDASGDIYAASIYNNTGSIGWHWGGSPSAGVMVYDGAASNTTMALVFSGYVTEITSGTADTEYLYDSLADFSSIVNNDVIINDDDATISYVTVTNILNNQFLELNSTIITPGNFSYRIGGGTPIATGTIGWVYSLTEFGANTLFNINDLIINNTTPGSAYLTNKVIVTFPPPNYQYTVNRSNVNLNTTDTYSVYAYKLAGTADTNIVYDSAADFSSVNINDIVVNLSTAESDIIDSKIGTTVLTLHDSSKFIFYLDNTPYQILRLPSATQFVTSGKPTLIGANTITQTGRNFSTDGVVAGDIIYNITTKGYTTISGIASDTLTLSSQIFSDTSQCFLVIRFTDYTGILFTWQESNNIYAKVIDAATGDKIFPDNTTTSKYTITDHPNNARNPHPVSDSFGNAIVIYELDAGGGTWDIRAKKINGVGTLLWADPANDTTDPGISLVTGQTPSGSTLIKKVLPDGNNGAWVLYETNAPTVGLAHIKGDSTVNNFTISPAGFADIATISSTQILLVYEYYTAGNPSRIFARIYNNTPAASTGPVQVSVDAVTKAQYYPTATPDGNGGALISWLDSRYFPNIYYVLYAQHLDSSLNKLYVSDKFVGIPVKDTQSANPYEIYHSLLQWDNNGSLPNEGIYIWVDERSSAAGEVDIYFQNVQ